MTRKCTNEGRALMQLDLRQFQLKVEGLTRLRPLPDAALVETYIKAFYLPESSLDQWVRQHTVIYILVILSRDYDLKVIFLGVFTQAFDEPIAMR